MYEGLVERRTRESGAESGFPSFLLEPKVAIVSMATFEGEIPSAAVNWQLRPPRTRQPPAGVVRLGDGTDAKRGS